MDQAIIQQRIRALNADLRNERDPANRQVLIAARAQLRARVDATRALLTDLTN